MMCFSCDINCVCLCMKYCKIPLINGNRDINYNTKGVTIYSGYSPEVNRYGKDPLRLGAEFGTYPMARSLILGFNLKF